MDRLNQLRGAAGGSGDSTLDTTSPPSEAFITANESSSKYFSLSEVDSTFDISPIKDVSLASASTDPERTITDADELISNLSPINKKSDILDSYKIGKQIEAANILSGGVDIFDDNENSYDGDELVIDDNVEIDEKSNPDLKQGESVEFKNDDNLTESTLMDVDTDIASKDTEVVLQIDGKNVDAIDIGNGLYLYRKEGQEELAAVQIIDDDQQQPSFKFLKVRENTEGNLEVYEEIEIEVPKEVPVKEGKSMDKNTSHVPIKDINKVINDPSSNKVADGKNKTPQKDIALATNEVESDDKDALESKTELNLNGKMMKFSESRKSPVIGSFTPMTYHSTPNKEGIPLTKTMVDMQLQPSRHSDNVKKTIEVHTENCKHKLNETPTKNKDVSSDLKEMDISTPNKEEICSVDEEPQSKEVEKINESNKTDIDIEKNYKDNGAVVDDKPEAIEAISECILESTEVTTDNDDSLVVVTDDLCKEKEIAPITNECKENNADTNTLEETSKPALEEKSNQDIKELNVSESVITDKSDNYIEIENDSKVPNEDKSVEPATDMIKVNNESIVAETKDEEVISTEKAEVMPKEADAQREVKDKTQNAECNENKEQTVLENKSIEAIDFHVDAKSEISNNTEKAPVEDLKMSDDDPSDLIIVSDIVEIEDEEMVNNEIENKNEIVEKVAEENPSSTKVEDTQDKSALDNTKKIQAALESTMQIVAASDGTEPIDAALDSTKQIVAASDGTKKIDAASDSTKQIDVASDGTNKIDPASDSTKQIDVASDGTKQIDVASDGTEQIENGSDGTEQIENASGGATQIDAASDNTMAIDVASDSTKLIVAESESTKKIDAASDSTKKIDAASDSTKEMDVTSDSSKKIDASLDSMKKIDASSDIVKVYEKKQREDDKPPTMCVNKLDIKGAGTEINKDVEKQTLIEKSFKIGMEPKQLQLLKKDKQINKVEQVQAEPNKEQTKMDLKAPKDETTSKIDNKPSQAKITLQKDMMVGKIKEIKVSSGDSKFIIANSKSELTLKTGSCTTKPSTTKAETTLNKASVQTDGKKEIAKISIHIDRKPANNINAAVPFGKWTEANRQEFLNKIKESKVPVTISNSKPIKNSNDLNRRDVLKKIDSQRQSNNAASKAQESSKTNVKNEKVFTNKPIIAQDQTVQKQIITQDSKIPLKVEVIGPKSKIITIKKVAKQEVVQNNKQSQSINTQALIDKTVEGLINRGYPPKLQITEIKSTSATDSKLQRGVDIHKNQPSTVPPASLDAIEMKMNELHGIPFIERPPHELPRPNNPPFNNYNKAEKEKPAEHKAVKIPNLLPYSNKNTPKVKENIIDVDSEEEIIEHEPVTGDIEMAKKGLPSNLPLKEKVVVVDTAKVSAESPKKETIITENDFDKFARRNSVTYENCITVSFDGKESHNVIQTVVEKDILKPHTKNDVTTVETKPNVAQKAQLVRQNVNPVKLQPVLKVASANDDTSKNHQSKVKIAYQTALTAKLHKEGPITVIEDKPVKVVFVDANPEFIPSKLNVQGQHLSPAKKPNLDLDSGNTNESLDLEITESIEDSKLQDESKPKIKHQRKQVLTPVEAPELELIEPKDLGIEVSPKKKRKTEDTRVDKNSKNVIHKKSYLLGRSTVVEDKVTKPVEVTKSAVIQPIHRNEDLGSNETVTALDNLVKAAELLENQSESMNTSNDRTSDSQPETPIKRGRGRPRKYPLPEGGIDKAKIPSPQKKPRLIDAKPIKRDTTTEEEESSDDEIVKENWTMGKINENIVCPICNKLFRSENVVFKHVKHCTGPSPNRSDAEKRSPRRPRHSQESDSKSEDMDIDEEISTDIKKYTPKKRRSKDSSTKSDTDKEDVIVIEDTPIKEKPEKDDDRKVHESRKLSKNKIQNRIVNNLVCEFCGKTFRQLSYLVSHKLQHKKEEPKKGEKDVSVSKSVISCDICKKEFRKLHHLVQHRHIHNAPSSRQSRKSSSDQEDTKSEKEDVSKQNEDPSAGFRCEPCDKSFRKLYHLVEHRETHDGINRQKVATTVPPVVEKPTPSPQCEICKKTFRKLHHLIEHKEQHLETSSEKSDDKSVKSSLSTKDIIHECPLCYMVFPNEHSLNKHSVICQRKKRQSKQPKPTTEEDGDSLEVDENTKSDENKVEDSDEPEIIAEEVKVVVLEKNDEKEKVEVPQLLDNDDVIEIIEKPPPIEVKEKVVKHQELPKHEEEIKTPIIKTTTIKEVTLEIPEVKMKVEEKVEEKIPDVPKKKTPAKNKLAPTVTKRQKVNAPAPYTIDKSPVETSDEDEVRYMLNPNLVVDETSEGKVFMKVRAKKRNSLQIERPHSKDLIKRRTSLQHPPKIPRLKPKPVEPKLTATLLKNIVKTPKLEPVPSTDSDDSDVKYSFPKTTPERTKLRERPSRDMERKPQRKSLAEKRKTLSGIAKRKSLGKTASVRYKETTSPPKQVKRRTAEAEHRCDCGELFSSAALLSRHTSLAHTPPRIRRRRTPPPALTSTSTSSRPATRRSTDKPKPNPGPASRKSSVRSDTSATNAKTTATRKSSLKNDKDTRKSVKPAEKEPKITNASTAKSRRSMATRTSAVLDKTKKPTQKSKI